MEMNEKYSLMANANKARSRQLHTGDWPHTIWDALCFFSRDHPHRAFHSADINVLSVTPLLCSVTLTFCSAMLMFRSAILTFHSLTLTFLVSNITVSLSNLIVSFSNINVRLCYINILFSNINVPLRSINVPLSDIHFLLSNINILLRNINFSLILQVQILQVLTVSTVLISSTARSQVRSVTQFVTPLKLIYILQDSQCKHQTITAFMCLASSSCFQMVMCAGLSTVVHTVVHSVAVW